MRQLTILCGVLLIIAGGLWVADASQARVTTLDLTYDIATPDTAVTPADADTRTKPVSPDAKPNFIPAVPSDIPGLGDTALASVGGCPSGVCPLSAGKRIVERKTEATVAVEAVEGAASRPLRAVAGGGVKIVRAAFGHQRRVERRSNRQAE